MIDPAAIEISAAVIPCAEGSPAHAIDPDAWHCTRCNRPIEDLLCPVHDKAYSHNVDLDDSGGFLRKWICRLCLAEGTDPYPEAREYQILRGRKLARPSGGQVNDSPRPDMMIEFPRQQPKG